MEKKKRTRKSAKATVEEIVNDTEIIEEDSYTKPDDIDSKDDFLDMDEDAPDNLETGRPDLLAFYRGLHQHLRISCIQRLPAD